MPFLKGYIMTVKVKTEAQERKESFIQMIFWAAIQMIFWAAIWLVLLQYVTACTNWQGMEFRIGVGQYNGANETKTFTKEVEKK